ncbi:MAG: transposase [archaeon]|nr:transposase [archaeon]
MVLGNTMIHTAKMVQKAAEILNINLIFLRQYCPDLNPIGDIWRAIKKITYKTNYNSTKNLINLFKDKFYEIIGLKSFYENWLEQNVINF